MSFKVCSRGHRYQAARCSDCQKLYWQQRKERERVRYYAGYKRERRELIAAESWCHNPECPYPDAGTSANPLTVEHLIPLIRGGIDGPKTVLCKRCNSGRRDRGSLDGETMSGYVGRPPRARRGWPERYHS